VSDLVERVERTVRQRGLLQSGQSIVVAVSGGVDSMVLLDALHRLAAPWRWHMVVAHFNHQLRGSESDADERLVRRAAQRMGLEFVTDRWAVAEQRAARKLGLEMGARLARHDFLGRVAEERKIPTIALAHHADDQAELFFLRLFRGAGGEGLAGMKFEGMGIASRSRFFPVRLVRPLLELRKAELLAYAKEQQIRFREDASNASLHHKRNRIRHELLPLLSRKFDAAVVTTVVRAMDLVGADAEFVRQEAERWLLARRRVPFEQLHPAVQRQCLRIQLSRLLVAPNYEMVEHLRLCPNKAATAGPNCDVLRDDAGWIVRKEKLGAAFSPNEIFVDLTAGQGTRNFDGVKISWKVKGVRGVFRRGAPRAGHECFDAAKAGPWVRLRHWRGGDRFQPIGMTSAVKLQDLFTNLKIPRARRRKLIVATTGSGEIWWVEGVRIGERFKIEETTGRVLEWQWRRTA
jgi:tRNA(Ile)-lysidine synthase